MRPHGISHTRVCAKMRCQRILDTPGCDLNAFQTPQRALRRGELVLWALWALIWSFPYEQFIKEGRELVLWAAWGPELVISLLITY